MAEQGNVPYPAINTLQDVKDTIAKALESVGLMKKRVQIAAVAVLIFAAKADTDEKKTEILAIANNMVVDLGDGIRSKGLIAFFQKYGFRLDMVDKKNGFIKVKLPETITEKLNDAKAQHWYTMSPENPFQDYSLKAAIQSLVKQAKAKAKDEQHADQIDVDMDMVEVLQALVTPDMHVKAEGALKLVQKIAA